MNLLGVLARVSSMTMVSRILGFVRDAIIARIFGAGMAMDAFVVAFRLPNLLRRIFAEGAFSQAFVPILAEYKLQQSPQATREFVQYVAGMLIFALTIVTAIGIVSAPVVIWLTANGFTQDGTRFDLAVQLLKIVMPYILLISLSSFVGSILNTFGKFSIPAFTPTLLNVSFIVFAVFFVPYFDPPIVALAWAVLFGGILQLGFQLPWLWRLGFLRVPKFSLKNHAVNRVMKQMLPSIIGSSVAQFSLVINTVFASFLVAGSVSWLYYADRLMELPSGVIGAALGTILLPSLSKHAAANNTQEFSALLDWGLKLCLLLILPATVGLITLAFPLIATLFMYRQFTLHDAQMTQWALTAYAVGLPAMILVKIFAPAFYAQKNVKTPMRVGIISLGFTQLCNLILIWHLQHIGLALAIALGACVNASLLLFLLLKRQIYQPKTNWRRLWKCLTVALLVMVGGLQCLQYFCHFDWIQSHGWWRFAQFMFLFVAGVILYFGALFACGLKLREFKRTEI